MRLGASKTPLLAPQIAWVVIGDGRLHLSQLQLVRFEQVGQELRRVLHLQPQRCAAQSGGIGVLPEVETGRTGGDYLLHTHRSHGLDVVLDQLAGAARPLHSGTSGIHSTIQRPPRARSPRRLDRKSARATGARCSCAERTSPRSPRSRRSPPALCPARWAAWGGCPPRSGAPRFASAEMLRYSTMRASRSQSASGSRP